MSNYLIHYSKGSTKKDHKYVKRYMSGGKWVYVYANDKVHWQIQNHEKKLDEKGHQERLAKARDFNETVKNLEKDKMVDYATLSSLKRASSKYTKKVNDEVDDYMLSQASSFKHLVNYYSVNKQISDKINKYTKKGSEFLNSLFKKKK